MPPACKDKSPAETRRYCPGMARSQRPFVKKGKRSDCQRLLGSRAEVNQSLVSRSWRQAVKKHSCCLKALRVSSGHAHGNCGLVDAVLQPGKDLNIRHLRQNTAEAQLRAASITPCLHLPQHSESFHCLCKITRYTLTRFLNSLRMEWPCRCCSGHQINHRCKPLQRSSALLCPPRDYGVQTSKYTVPATAGNPTFAKTKTYLLPGARGPLCLPSGKV